MNNKLRFAVVIALAAMGTAGLAVSSASAQQSPTVVVPPSAVVSPPMPVAPAVGQASQDAAVYQTPQGSAPQQPTQPGANPYAPPVPTQAPVVQAPVVQAPVIPQPAPVPAQAPSSLPAALPPLPPYQQFVDQNFPASPEQIESLRRTINATQRAVAKPVAPAKPQSGSISVSLSPGAVPPKIKAYFGNTSSIVVMDATGAPWPVENFRLGNASAFQLNRMDGPHGSSFALDANTPHAQSNMILQLVGAQSPIVIELVAGQPEYDARLEIRVQGRGPNATAATTANMLPSGTDGRLLSILDGVAPAGAKSLNVMSGNAQAWMLPSGRMAVRTPVKIVSPAPTSFVSSADGTHVYEFMPTSDLLGMSNGDFVNITVKGW